MRRINKWEILVEPAGRMKLPATIYAGEGISLESEAVSQLKDAASLPGLAKVLATPDIHVGFGVPIGSVLGSRSIVIPAAVGYDINCGMRLYTTDQPVEGFDAGLLARRIAGLVPLGEGKKNIALSYSDFKTVLEGGIEGLLEIAGKLKSKSPFLASFDPAVVQENRARIEDGGSLPGDAGACSERAVERGASQLATLGGGNHFIEIGYVEKVFDQAIAEEYGLRENCITLMIHTGSRGFGHQVGDDYMRLAREINRRRNDDRPNDQLNWLDLSSREGRQYLGAMNAAANFAFANRELIGALVLESWRQMNRRGEPRLLYDVPHNIAKFESYGGDTLLVHRKGATRAFGASRLRSPLFARTGQPVLIPGSMGTASYVLAGVDDNEQSLCSVNHGAGRVMSRTAARGKGRGGKKRSGGLIAQEEFERSMAGIELICEDRRAIREEAPAAYKDIDAVVDTVVSAGLARLVAHLKPLAVLKG